MLLLKLGEWQMIKHLSKHQKMVNYKWDKFHQGSARGVMVIVIGNGHGDTSSNPGRD